MGNTNNERLVLKNVQVFVEDLFQICYITKVTFINTMARIGSVIWSECLYPVPVKELDYEC